MKKTYTPKKLLKIVYFYEDGGSKVVEYNQDKKENIQKLKDTGQEVKIKKTIHIDKATIQFLITLMAIIGLPLFLYIRSFFLDK